MNLSEPASSESAWQERREYLPDDADQLAGDKYSTKRFLALREVVREEGRVLDWRVVDEYGRTYVE